MLEKHSEQTDTFATLLDIAELLDKAWDTPSSDNYAVRAFMIATGTLLTHGHNLDSNLAETRNDLKSIFSRGVVESFGKLDPVGAVVEINAMVDGIWSDLSPDNYFVQVFIRSTEFLIEKGAIKTDGAIALRFEEMQVGFAQSPSI